MANPFFTSHTRYPLTAKPLTKPDNKLTFQDLFNITVTIQSFLRDLDTLFLGHTLATAPPTEGWTDIGTGATFTGDRTEQAIHAEAGSTGTNIIARVLDLDKSPYKLRALVHSQFPPKDFLGAGVCLRDSSSGELMLFGVLGSDLVVSSYTDESTTGTTHETVPFNPQPAQWYKIEDDETDLKFLYSGDGENWIEYYSTPSSAGWDQVGFWASNENTTTPELGLSARLFSWRVEDL